MQETVLSLLQLVPDLLIVVREHRDGEWHFVLPSSSGSLKGRSMVCFSSSVVVGGQHYFRSKSYAGIFG